MATLRKLSKSEGHSRASNPFAAAPLRNWPSKVVNTRETSLFFRFHFVSHEAPLERLGDDGAKSVRELHFHMGRLSGKLSGDATARWA